MLSKEIKITFFVKRKGGVRENPCHRKVAIVQWRRK
jgi:hypothetical protein